MIIKYKHEGKWGMVDGLSNVVYDTFSQDIQIKRYLNQVESRERIEPTLEVELPTHIKMHNDLFTIVSEGIEEIDGYNTNVKCLITVDKLPTIEHDLNGIMIIADLEKHLHYDKVAFICNDEVYLLNDNGVTIERIN